MIAQKRPSIFITVLLSSCSLFSVFIASGHAQGINPVVSPACSRVDGAVKTSIVSYQVAEDTPCTIELSSSYVKRTQQQAKIRKNKKAKIFLLRDKKSAIDLLDASKAQRFARDLELEIDPSASKSLRALAFRGSRSARQFALQLDGTFIEIIPPYSGADRTIKKLAHLSPDSVIYLDGKERLPFLISFNRAHSKLLVEPVANQSRPYEPFFIAISAAHLEPLFLSIERSPVAPSFSSQPLTAPTPVIDLCPDDPGKMTPQVCGCGILEILPCSTPTPTPTRTATPVSPTVPWPPTFCQLYPGVSGCPTATPSSTPVPPTPTPTMTATNIPYPTPDCARNPGAFGCPLPPMPYPTWTPTAIRTQTTVSR